MIIEGKYIRCPKCGWEPDESCRWVCDVCNTKWNTFKTNGQCPGCHKVFEDTWCSKRKGGCGQPSLNTDWYERSDFPVDEGDKKFVWFWKNKNKLPITNADKEWIESDLLRLAEMFEPVYFKSLTTITPDNKYFDREFTGTEEDVEFILKRLISIMNIDSWEIQLMFYSNRPTEFSEGIVETPQDKLKGSWKSSLGEYVNKGLGHKEIWIELGQINDPISLTATIAHELAHYKLLGEYRVEENNELLTDLTAIVFGFGIFMGNSSFKFSQWMGTTHQGWQMQKSGYLPEQIIGYTMAWLAHYRNEDISWTHYLNKTMKKYFMRSYEYIEKNNDLIKWKLDS